MKRGCGMSIGILIPIIGASLVLLPALHAMLKARREID
jgi:hypothetical protein